jgi:hypothetical protein
MIQVMIMDAAHGSSEERNSGTLSDRRVSVQIKRSILSTARWDVNSNWNWIRNRM